MRKKLQSAKLYIRNGEIRCKTKGENAILAKSSLKLYIKKQIIATFAFVPHKEIEPLIPHFTRNASVSMASTVLASSDVLESRSVK